MSASTEKGNFKVYLEAYCNDHNLSKEDAMKHKIVQDIKEYYEQSAFESMD